MPTLPQVQTESREVNQLQQNIAQVLNPISRNPITQGSLLTGQDLVTGSNSINTGLNRMLQGWIVVDIDAAATIYSTASDNKTLTLNSSAPCTVTLYVF